MTEWITPETALPDNHVRVLAVMATPRPVVIVAWHAQARTIRADDVHYDATDDLDSDYDDETDTYYVPEGWYEDCVSWGYYCRASNTITHWQPLPAIPHG